MQLCLVDETLFEQRFLKLESDATWWQRQERRRRVIRLWAC